MSSLNFYQELPAFKEFESITSDEGFRIVPPGWWVVLTDVRGSTQAIEEGHYDQINMIGASAITCVMNILGEIQFPFVFGGDGATLLIPDEYRSSVEIELQRLRDHCRREFKTDLRVGFVSTDELHRRNLMLQIGKMELSSGNYLAQFRGAGLTEAETMIKKGDPHAKILGDTDSLEAPNLHGLSCRLSPIESSRGLILSLLAKPLSPDVETQKLVVRELLVNLRRILNGDLKSASPVQRSKLKWKLPPRNFLTEFKLRKSEGSGFRRRIGELLWVALQNASLKFSFPLGPFAPKKYVAELIANSDFCKFDETLRMVVDCSEAQAQAIQLFLIQSRARGEITFGLHRSQHAIMTCMVFAATQNQHVHFVDGGTGGYAMAASHMKKLKN